MVRKLGCFWLLEQATPIQAVVQLLSWNGTLIDYTISLLNGTALQPGDIGAAATTFVIYTGGGWALLNPLVSQVYSSDLSGNNFIRGSDSGSANAYVFDPAVASLFNLQNGSLLTIQIFNANNNTGASH